MVSSEGSTAHDGGGRGEQCSSGTARWPGPARLRRASGTSRGRETRQQSGNSQSPVVRQANTAGGPRAAMAMGTRTGRAWVNLDRRASAAGSIGQRTISSPWSRGPAAAAPAPAPAPDEGRGRGRVGVSSGLVSGGAWGAGVSGPVVETAARRWAGAGGSTRIHAATHPRSHAAIPSNGHGNQGSAEGAARVSRAAAGSVAVWQRASVWAPGGVGCPLSTVHGRPRAQDRRAGKRSALLSSPTGPQPRAAQRGPTCSR